MSELKVGDYVRCYLTGTFQIMSIDENQVWLKRRFTRDGRLIKNGATITFYLNCCALASDCITKNIENELNILKHIHNESNSSNPT